MSADPKILRGDGIAQRHSRSTAEQAARLAWSFVCAGDRRLVVTLFGAERETGTVAAIRVRSVRQGEIDPAVLGEPSDPLKGGGGDRGEVGEYSYGSRRRLREAVWSVQPALLPRRRGRSWVRPSSFVTLTYPSTWPDDPDVWKLHLTAWLKRLRRRWPDAWAIWALEIQRRGAPHYHLIIRWPPESTTAGWRERQRWLSESWAQAVAGRGRPVDADHLAAGTNLRPLVTSKALAQYVSKPGSKQAPKRRRKDALQVGAAAAAELAKRSQRASEDGGGYGRWWGVHNRAAYNRSAVVVEAQLPIRTAARIAVELEASWREFFGKAPGDEWEYPPRWLAGRPAFDVLDAAGVTGDLFAADWVNPATGEVLLLTEDDFGAARYA